MVFIPLAAVALLEVSGLADLVPDGQTILLVSLLATCTRCWFHLSEGMD